MMILAFRGAVVGRQRFDPKADDITAILRQLDEILTELTTPENADSGVSLEVKGLRDAVEAVKKRLPLKDGKMDGAGWDSDANWPLDKRRSIYADLDRIWKIARGINAGELTRGRLYFFMFLILFVLVSGAYLYWGRQAPPGLADVVDVDRLLNTTETRLTELRSADESSKAAKK